MIMMSLGALARLSESMLDTSNLSKSLCTLKTHTTGLILNRMSLEKLGRLIEDQVDQGCHQCQSSGKSISILVGYCPPNYSLRGHHIINFCRKMKAIRSML